MAYDRYSKLLWFDKVGNPINATYGDDKIWRFTLHFKEISINLFENETLFLVEEFEDSFSNTIYGTPHIAQPSSDSKMFATLATTGSSAFVLFTIDNPYNTKPFIDISSSIESTIVNSPSDTYNSTTKRLITSNNNTNSTRIDIAISSKEEDVHQRQLVINDGVNTIAIIDLYGETVGEDERLNNLLSIFGETITEREEFIFRQSDINEDLPNFRIINQKRKELLVELHNIQPYLASIKGIVNIIKFFGFYDLKIKEYWKNVETNTLYLEDVHIGDFDDLSVKNKLKEYPFQKTSYFGLFYDINSIVDGQTDELQLPLVQPSNIFSNEEVLIKLFGLKNYIKEHQIGGVSEIIDIIGEATFFSKYTINIWTDTTEVFSLDPNVRPKFTIDKRSGYIQDVRPIINTYSGCLLPTNISVDDTPTVQFGNYPNCFIGFFNPLLMPDPQFLDEPLIEVGMPIALSNKSFDLAWKDVKMSWNSTINQNLSITWANISSLNYYEIEWVIKRVATRFDARQFEYKKRGTVTALKDINVILPYTGLYDVTLILYGWDNEISKHTEKSYIEVFVKEADFISFFRYLDKNLQTWETNYLSWSSIHSEWKAPIFDNDNFIIDENEIKNRSFNTLNFEDLDSLGITNVGIKPPSWNKFPDNTWEDFGFETYKNLIHPKEKLARFVIDTIQAGGQIQVGVDTFDLPNDINLQDYVKVAALLNAETGDDISSFVYTARSLDPSLTPSFIDCVSKFYGFDGDRFVGSSGGVTILNDSDLITWSQNVMSWVDNPLTWANMTNAFRTQAAENPFSFDNVQIYNNRFNVPLMIPVFMVVDNSKMAGKTNAHWKIVNEDTGEVVLDIDSFTMTYRFNVAGYYSIEVTIEDTNGNTNIINKVKHLRAMKIPEFRNKIATINNLNIEV